MPKLKSKTQKKLQKESKNVEMNSPTTPDCHILENLKNYTKIEKKRIPQNETPFKILTIKKTKNNLKKKVLTLEDSDDFQETIILKKTQTPEEEEKDQIFKIYKEENIFKDKDSFEFLTTLVKKTEKDGDEDNKSPDFVIKDGINFMFKNLLKELVKLKKIKPGKAKALLRDSKLYPYETSRLFRYKEQIEFKKVGIFKRIKKVKKYG